MNRLSHNARTVFVLWQRDLLLFVKQRSRVAGALITPLLIWLAIGAGISPSFQLETGDLSYMEFFFPGVVFVLLLNLGISATMTVIEDRRQGFLQGVLVAPGSRWAMVLGKTLGSSTVALIHGLLFLLLAPAAGFSYGTISWFYALGVMALSTIALTATGFAIAWALNSVTGYHVVMSLVLFPLWILSGAMFPTAGLHPVMRAVVTWNPMSYAMSGLRRAMYGGPLPAGVDIAGAGPLLEFTVLGITAAVMVAVACRVASRKNAAV